MIRRKVWRRFKAQWVKNNRKLESEREEGQTECE